MSRGMDDATKPDPHADEFAIPASASLQEQQSRVLKHGDTFAVFDRNGDIRQDRGGPEGIFHLDTRHLSRLELFVENARPILLSSTIRDDNAMLTCDLTNPDIDRDRQLEHDLIHIRRTKFVFEGRCHERIAVRNFSNADQDISLGLRFDADFADLFEVRGHTRARYGTRHGADVDANTVRLSYTGLDERLRVTRLHFFPDPTRLTDDRAFWKLHLPRGAAVALFVRVNVAAPAATGEQGDEVFFSAVRRARRALRKSASRAAAIATSNEVFNEAMRRSISDLAMLITDKPEGPYPYAGIPWYSTAFGRDAIITALQTLWMDPTIARGVLGYLAAHQASRTDPVSDAEPGKILHEVRNGEMAELGEVPFRRYYGSVDSTPLFIMLAAAYHERTGDAETIKRLWPNIEAALAWIDGPGDPDGDGFVEYARKTDKGLVNQGWKDSWDSIFHADGSNAEGPIALIEVQGYVHAAKRGAARLALLVGDTGRAYELNAAADDLRQKIEAEFWSDEIGMYALALDGRKRPCAVRASNAGHLLLTQSVSAERAAAVARQMLGSAFFSGWGVRTVAVGEARYNPMSYHNGSVWPHDNSLIGMGFGHYGLRADAARVLEGLFDAAAYIDLRRLPELLCGFPRRRTQGPTFYPVACSPQAWSAVALPALLVACLGLRFDLQQRAVVFTRPHMPRFLEEVTLYGLALGNARVDVLLRGTDGDVSMRVLSRSGDVKAMLIN